MVRAVSRSIPPRPAQALPRPYRWIDSSRAVAPHSGKHILLEQAVRSHPDNLRFLRELCSLYDRMGLYDELIARAESHRSDPVIAHLLGVALASKGELARAVELLEYAVENHVGWASVDLAKALEAIGEPQRASLIARQRLRNQPGDTGAFYFEAGLLLKNRDTTALRKLCDEYHDQPRLLVMIRSFRLQADMLDGNVDPECLPPFFAENIEHRALLSDPTAAIRLCEGVSGELSDHPNVTKVPYRVATQGGSRVASIQVNPPPHLADLIARVREAVEAYLDRHDELLPPGKAGADEIVNLKLKMWAVLLDKGGHQNWHAHPDGCVSGIFYVDAPGIGSAIDDPAGWISFGFPRSTDVTQPGNTHRLQPQQGALVLVPSYLPHRTEPHAGDRKRISIAFDVLAS